MVRIVVYIMIVMIPGCALYSSKTAGNQGKGHYYIKGNVEGLEEETVILFSVQFEKMVAVDSAKAGSEGNFEFILESSDKSGIYRIVPRQDDGTAVFNNDGIEIIFNYEDVVFSTNFSDPAGSMKISSSVENSLYYEYKRERNKFFKKITALDAALAEYPPGDWFYRRMERQYNRLEKSRVKFEEKIIGRNEGTLFSAIAAFEKIPQTDSDTRRDTAFLKKNFFSEDHFIEPVLLNTGRIPARIDRYISLYTHEKGRDESHLKELKDAAENILYYSMTDEEVFYTVLEYLVNYLMNIELEEVASYLVNNFLHADICMEEDRRILSGEPLETGMRAPGFRIRSLDGNEVELYSLDNEYILVFFWGSWCPYCRDIASGLFDMYTDFMEADPSLLEVIAIGIEEDEGEWMSAIAEWGLSGWINCSSIMMWDCPVSRKYTIEGTPTMFLLDRERNVVSKPHQVRSLRRFLSRRLDN